MGFLSSLFGGKKKQTIGHKYYVGMHMVLCHGRVDAMSAIIVGGKELWRDKIDSNDTLTFDKPELFGGERSEGGIVGDLDVMFGGASQTTNPYLENTAGAVPAFRGVLSVVLKQMYLGTNAYIKNWEFRCTRVTTFDNWYPEKKAIDCQFAPTSLSGSGRILVIMDGSDSMMEFNAYEQAFDRATEIHVYIEYLKGLGLDYDVAFYKTDDFGRAMEFTYNSTYPEETTYVLSSDGYNASGYSTGGPHMTIEQKFNFPKPIPADSVSKTDHLQDHYESFDYVSVNPPSKREPIYGAGYTGTAYEFFIAVPSPEGTKWIFVEEAFEKWKKSWTYDVRLRSPMCETRYEALTNNQVDKARLSISTARGFSSQCIANNSMGNFLDIDSPGNKIIVTFTDGNTLTKTSGNHPFSFFYPSDLISKRWYPVQLNSSSTLTLPTDPSYKFINGLMSSAMHYRSFGASNPDARVCTYEKMNLIKSMNVNFARKYTPGISEPEYSLEKSYQQYTGTLPYNYFDSSPLGSDSSTVMENFKKMLRWEYDTPDPSGGGTSDDNTIDCDMNPAHIVRECLTNPIWGMGYPSSDIDDSSFRNAADVFYDEELGISILLDQDTTVEEFIKEILRHVDAVLYIDRTTGKFCLKPVRNDYSVGDLLSLNESNIISLSDYSKPVLGDLVNSVTVNAWDKKTNNTLTVSVQNSALFMMQGRIVGTKVQYPGITNKKNAARLAQRDLKTYSTALVKCTIEASDVASGLNVGSVFKMSWDDYGLANMVMRVVGIDYGSDKSHSVKITAMQDIFTIPDLPIVNVDTPSWVDPVAHEPSPIIDAMSSEAPYYVLCDTLNKAEVDNYLAVYPNSGYQMVAAVKPIYSTKGLVYIVNEDDSTTYDGDLSYSVNAQAINDFDAMDTEIEVTLTDEASSSIGVGSWAYVDNEYILVEGYTKLDTDTYSVTIKRGVLDTNPRPHSAGVKFYFLAQNNWIISRAYAVGDTSRASLASLYITGETNKASNYPVIVSIEGRAIKPYPPQNVKINGVYFNDTKLSEMNITWAHRNRLVQADQDGTAMLGFVDDSLMSPEEGTSYSIQLINSYTDEVIYSVSDLTGTSHTIPQSILPLELGSAIFVIKSTREGHECLYPYVQEVIFSEPIGGNMVFTMDDFSAPPSGGNITFTMS